MNDWQLDSPIIRALGPAPSGSRARKESRCRPQWWVLGDGGCSAVPRSGCYWWPFGRWVVAVVNSAVAKVFRLSVMWWFISARWRANFFPLQVQSVVGVWHSCTPTPQAPTLTYPQVPLSCPFLRISLSSLLAERRTPCWWWCLDGRNKQGVEGSDNSTALDVSGTACQSFVGPPWEGASLCSQGLGATLRAMADLALEGSVGRKNLNVMKGER